MSLKLPEKCCGNCYFWSAMAISRGFLGLCGHPDRGKETTDKFEGTNCADFETHAIDGEGCRNFTPETAEWLS